ncbi:MAG TPA: polysaccharide biosynthesis tyrosine autokinase [Blastocatellia bacterium]|nr:polysaccharide biosynthesis tyrosine autokinase [Blastocatellia bacterium]
MLELRKPLAVTHPASLPAFEQPRPEIEFDNRTHLRDYWSSIRKHLWLIIGLTVLITTIAVIYLVRKPNIYEAQALVMVDMEDLNPVQGAASKNPVIVNSNNNDPAYFNTQLRILTSQGLLRRVVKTLDLENNPSFPRPSSMPERNKWWTSLQRTLSGESQEKGKETGKDEARDKLLLNNDKVPITSQAEMAEAKRLAPFIKDINDDLHVEPVIEKRLGYSRDNTRLIEIRYQHHDPEIAAKVVNGIAEAFIYLNYERRSETNVSTGDFLQKRIAELQSQIRNGEERLINYARNHQILSLNADQNTVVERLTVLNKQLLEAENKRKVAEAAYRAASAPGAASALAEENIARKIVDMEMRLAEFRQRRAQLLVENTEEWPEVKEVNQQITTLEAEIEKARSRSTTALLTNHETQYRQALAAEQALRKDFDKQRGETLTQNEAAINYRIIQQEIETNKNLLDGLLQRYKENDVVMAGVRNNIHVIDHAIAPDKPIGPRRWQGAILVFCFGLALSVGLALFLEYLNDTISSTDEAEKMLQLPALVTIPIVNEMRNRKLMPEDLFAADSHSALAESYRQLRTSLMLSTPGRPPKTLLVTSSMPGEGKTTTAVNLAFCLAQIGARVLIIDADMRRPRLHSIFGMSRLQGLSTCLAHEISEAQVLDMIRQYRDSRLHLLTAGPVPPNPAELLGSNQMRQLLATLESHFTHIIIDSPPSASFTDAVLLSSLADGILMVVQSGKTQYKVVRHSLNLLAGAGARIFGVVLNQVSNRQHDHYYHDYYQQPVEQTGDHKYKLSQTEMAPSFPETVNGTVANNGTATIHRQPSEELPAVEFDNATRETLPTEANLGVPHYVSNVPLKEERMSAETDEEAERFRSLCAVFDHPSQAVRERAVLNEFGSDRLSDLARALREAPFARSRRIAAAIVSSGLADEAINYLTNGSEKYYDTLSLLLLMMKAGEAQPLLRAIKEHPNQDVRIAAISLLALSQQFTDELHNLARQNILPANVQATLLTSLHLPLNRDNN